YPVFKSFFDLPVLLSFIFLAALFGLGVYMVKQAKVKAKVKTKSLLAFSQPQPLSQPAFRLVGFGILWFFITLSVESGIIPLDRLIDEYRVYLPSVGVSIAVVTGVFLIMEKLQSLKTEKVILVLLVLATGSLAVAASQRNEVWGGNIRLWEDTAQKSPAIAVVHNNLGYIYQALNKPDKAIEQYLIAINLKPDYSEAHDNLGIAYRFHNMAYKAAEQFLIAISLKPDFAKAYNNLGVIYQDHNMA